MSFAVCVDEASTVIAHSFVQFSNIAYKWGQPQSHYRDSYCTCGHGSANGYSCQDIRPISVDKETPLAMSLRHALLALVSGGPLTGYDAVKHFHSSVGHLWHAPDSQIYPELRRMQAEGLLDATEVPWGTKTATKTQYSLTEAGRTALQTWQNNPLTYALE